MQNYIINDSNNDVSCEKILKYMFEKSITCKFVIFANGRLCGNEAFFKTLGYSAEDIMDKHWRDITYYEDVDLFQKHVDAIASNEESEEQLIIRYIKKNCSILWAEVYTFVYRDSNNNIIFTITSVVDVTDSKRTELLLKESNEFFYTFIDSSLDLIFLKDQNFRHIMANQRLADSYGLEVSDVIGKTDYDLTDIKVADICRKTDVETINNNEAITSIEIINDKVYETRKFPVVLGEGSIGVGAHIRDITKEFIQQEKIDKVSETYRLIAECMLKPFIDVQKHLDFVLSEAIKLTSSEYGYIYFYDEDKKEFTLNSWTNGVMRDCLIMEKQTKYQLDKTGLWGEVVRQRKPIIINDYGMPNPLKKGVPKGHVAIKKYMSIPLFENNKIVAVIGFANKKTDYTQNDVQVITILMTGVWNAVKKREEERKTKILLERTQSMINDHGAVMLLIEPISGEIIEANNAAISFYGYSKEELLKMNISEIRKVSEDNGSDFCLRNLEKEQKHHTATHQLKNGEVRIVDVYSSIIEYNNYKVLYSIIFDVTNREEAIEQIHRLAYYDFLTGVYNRRYFEEEFIRSNNKENFPLAIILGDVNGLKIVNDSFGHCQGDQLLKEATIRIKERLSCEHIFARVGGDEFGIIVKQSNEEEIKLLTNQIEEYVNNCNNETDKYHLSISFGYGIQREKNDTLDELMKEAETLMYNRKNYNSRSLRNNTVNIILNTLFEKSESEKRHSERVGVICEVIAKKMRWFAQAVDRIRVAGSLHDIGKIGISEYILNKSSRLDNEEWKIMKTHTEKGARILRNTVEFKDIADIILYHHERYDGSGYPYGLKGEDIPIESRIIAVADAYDAMTNERSYRKALSEEDVVRELIECSGTQFDPEIVSIFMNEVIPEKSCLIDKKME